MFRTIDEIREANRHAGQRSGSPMKVDISTPVGEFQHYATRAQAIRAAETLASEVPA